LCHFKILIGIRSEVDLIEQRAGIGSAQDFHLREGLRHGMTA